MNKVKEISNKKVVIIFGVFIILVLLLAFAYAYWSRTFTQTGVNTNTYDCFDISFSENTEGVILENGYPQTDEEGLQNEPYTVTITNTCSTVASYQVVLNKYTSSTLEDTHIKVSANSEVSLLSDLDTTTSTIDEATGYILYLGVLAPKAEKEIEVRSWMDEDTTEEEGESTTFSYKITIEASTNKNKLLAAQILGNNIKTTSPTSEEFLRGEPYNENDYSRSGLYSAEDDEGTSYYFRGAVKNTYVSFAGKLWNIVRLNGDESIRLILYNRIGESAFNELTDDVKYVGYTYDNSHTCTLTNLCYSEDGTSSTIKGVIETWYSNNLSAYDDEIVLASFCNDTSIYSTENNTIYYGAYNRENNGSPSLKCADTSVSYGGTYKLKIGLLSWDELNMSGYSRNYVFPDFDHTYLLGDYIETMSSFESLEIVSGDFGDYSLWSVNDEVDVRPVINLKANTQITSGDGTSTNPYVIK